MEPSDFDALDDFIESALRSEPMRPVPFGFQRRVEDRLRVAALCDAERRRFRRCLGVAGMAVAVLACLGAFSVYSIHRGTDFAASIPGILGFYDGFASVFSFWWPGAVGTTVIVGCILALAVLLMELLSLRNAVAAD